MKIRVYKEYGALNSKPVFEAFEKGVLVNRDTLVDSYEDADCVVIWSVLFQGRMAANQAIWERANADNKPVVVLEIGTLVRNKTWRVGINGINRDAQFNEYWDIGSQRRNMLQLSLDPWQDNSKEFITIATQRPDSLQWVGMPSVEDWLKTTIDQIKEVSKRPIVIRPHPRDKITNFNLVAKQNENVYFDIPQSIGVADSVNFKDILERTHVLVNYCTSPAIEAVMRGVPVMVGPPSMAWEMNTEVENIETPNKPDRDIWFDRICHTEWTVDEIGVGEPWSRLRVLV